MTTDTPAFSPGLEGVPIAESSVSRVDGQAGRLTYRGYSIEDLTQHGTTFEELVALLYDGELPTATRIEEMRAHLERTRALTDDQIALARQAARITHPMFALTAAVAALGPMTNDFEPHVEQAYDRGIALIARVGHLVGTIAQAVAGREYDGPRPGESHAHMILRMITGHDPSPEHEEVLNYLLITQADHSAGNAGTFTSRVVTSTKAEPEAVVAASLCSLSGPAHGGANEHSLRLFQQIGDPAKAEQQIQRLLADKYKIPGFGHRVYHVKDPRSIVIQRIADRVITRQADKDMYEIALTVERVATDQLGSRGLFPNVDLFSGCVFAALDIPIDFFTPIFGASRTAGWMVHLREQWASGNRIFRPTQIYTGQEHRDFVPIGQR